MKLLALDLSTTSTGWAVFVHKGLGPMAQDKDPVELKEYGYLVPKVPGLKGLGYPAGQLLKILNLCEQVMALVKAHEPDHIAIEEINRGKNRLGQKVLDGYHFILLDSLKDAGYLSKLSFKDSDGPSGWRGDLGLRLTDEDKKLNKERKTFNKMLPKRARGKLPIINKKHLACRYVNKHFGMKFNVDKNKKDADVVDAIAMGYAVLLRLS